MYKLLLALLGFVAVVIIVLLIGKCLQKKEPLQLNYKGLCLFDVDGTLTTGNQNADVAQVCLDAGYAVGISTAGALYQPTNLTRFRWMPTNLYNFMRDHEFKTFNNVASGMLAGVQDMQSYKMMDLKAPKHTSIAGWRKGYSLEETAKKYGIVDPKHMIMFDDDRGFLSGLETYNKDFTLVCSGADCGGHLTVEKTKKALGLT